MRYGQVAGVDPSMTSTGLARRTCGAGIEGVTMEKYVTKSWKPRFKGDKGPWSARSDRLKRIAAAVAAFVHGGRTLVLYEGPSYGSKGGSTHDIAGNWWTTLHALEEQVYNDTHILVVTPSELKKYATGRGNAKKEEVMAAVIRRYPQFYVDSNDIADAVVLMAIASRLVGEPIEDSLPKVNLSVMPALEKQFAEIGLVDA